MIKMASVSEALSLLREHGTRAQLDTEAFPVGLSGGRVLVEDVTARVNQPPADISAMDGYAVRLADAARDSALKVIGESRAGTPFSGAIGVGECIRIFTGAHVPLGADHILIQEDAERDDDVVRVTEQQKPPSSIRRAGLDFRTGDVLVPAGTRMGPGAIALAAAGNAAEVRVTKRPRVGVLATGDELAPPGAGLDAGQVVNSIQPALLEYLRLWGAEAVDLGIATDEIQSVRDRIRQSLDLVVSIGGASVGDYDVVRDAFAEEGFERVFEKVAVKPGKPTWFSRRSGVLALGLPGNPAAALVTANLFLKPLVDSMLQKGSQEPSVGRAVSETAIPAGGQREEYLRAVLANGPDGRSTVRPWTNQDSSLLHPFLSANALIRREKSAPAVAPGDVVEFVLIETV